jgi:hypothetical protein
MKLAQDMRYGRESVSAEAEMGYCNRPRFFRVVNEISLGDIIRLGADDLDGVLVRSHRSIRAETEKHGAVRSPVLGAE